MRVCTHYKNIDEVIAMINSATIKNKDCMKDFHDAGLPSHPDSGLQDGQLVLELPYITVRTFQMFVHCQQLDKCRSFKSAEQKMLSM